MSGPAKKRLPRPRAVTVAMTPEMVAARLLTLVPPGEGEAPLPTLWRKTDFGRKLSRAEKEHLDAALVRLQEERQVVALEHGGNMFFAFAEPLRARLGGESGPVPVVTDHDLREAYRRLVRESGGFPDVKISLLARALGPAAGNGLGERLIGLWRTGDATLSLGDWSLAGEETRMAAVEMDGEQYLLVRFEE